MPQTSAEILEQFRRDHARDHARDINLALRPAYLDLLAQLGNPQHKLPPVFHVAGTNGKGSVCAFLRAMLEAEGYKVHVYTSPHLVRFQERIRIAGTLIGEEELKDILGECQRLAVPGAITYFEAATAAAFCAFARHPADFTLLEVGLGGRLDATNVVEKPLASIITRISFDHRDYLGNTLAGIAREKAGIMRAGVPCFSAPQPDVEVCKALREAAAGLQAPFFMGDEDWRVEKNENGFRFTDAQAVFDLPPPGLIGEHQFENAALSVAALSAVSPHVAQGSIARGLREVEWPARLEKIERGTLYKYLPPDWELWLDGGHNDSAGQALARQAWTWRDQDKAVRPLHIICGMLASKNPQEFLAPLAPHIASLQTVTIDGDVSSFTAEELAAEASAAGIESASPSPNLEQAMKRFSQSAHAPGRVLVCGSLYLVGEFLRLSGSN